MLSVAGLPWTRRRGKGREFLPLSERINTLTSASSSSFTYFYPSDGQKDVQAFLSHASKKLGPTISRLA